MIFPHIMITYHGTSDNFANELIAGKIEVDLGSGELGQGFYLGDMLHVAKAWAMNKYGSEAVVEVSMAEDDFYNFKVICLNHAEAKELRIEIKKLSRTKIHKLGGDIVWAPIVGGSQVYGDQHKWESTHGETFLNSNNVARRKR